jgi:hypothetical protein
MKDSIQQLGTEVAIVIYDAPLPPRYFRFTKKFIRTFFVVVPILLGICLIGLFLWGLGPRIMKSPRPTLPEVISPTDSKLIELENEVRLLSTTNKQLTDKLSAVPATTTGEDPFLMAIIKPYGMQNFLNQNRVTIDQTELSQESNTTHLKFQIISSNPETKVTGHILVFMVSSSGMMAYPVEANTSLSEGIKFSQGEPFSVSRLRPTDASFQQTLTGPVVKFVIYIFSREGDLLLIKETESYKVGNKS